MSDNIHHFPGARPVGADQFDEPPLPTRYLANPANDYLRKLLLHHGADGLPVIYCRGPLGSPELIPARLVLNLGARGVLIVRDDKPAPGQQLAFWADHADVTPRTNDPAGEPQT